MLYFLKITILNSVSEMCVYIELFWYGDTVTVILFNIFLFIFLFV